MMKGEQADYVIPLDKAFSFPPKKRVTKALAVVRAFVKKHTRYTNLGVTNEVNHFLHKHSKNIPKRIPATLLKDGSRIVVFLQGGKELAEFKKKKDEQRKKETKKDGKKGKEEVKKETVESKEEKAAAEEKKQKLEDKKEKESAAKAA